VDEKARFFPKRPKIKGIQQRELVRAFTDKKHAFSTCFNIKIQTKLQEYIANSTT
jgi:hypothetical protein